MNMKTESPRILLFVPPFEAVIFPSLAVHQLEAQLRADGLSCDICYSNALYASMIGFDLYHKISWRSPLSLLGDRIFAAYLERAGHPGVRPGQQANLLSRMEADSDDPLAGPEGLMQCFTPEAEMDFRSALELVLLEREYDIVGITCGCMQLCATEYHASIVKDLAPNCTIVIGGANCDGEMAEGILSFTRYIDHIFSGEADYAFTEFCLNFPYSKDAGSIIRCDPVEDLSKLQPPDFSAYYSEVAKCGYPYLSTAYVPYQSSRGCWWGQKSQCVFCGLNGANIRYRTKPVDKLLSELPPILQRHTSRNLMMVDCIMPNNYLTDLLPRIRDEVGYVNMFYETRANLKLSDLLTMRSCGFTSFQPGIESLSSSLLKRMHKGVSGVNNIRLLINSRRARIYPLWSILFGFPGDTREDYAEMLQAVPYLLHLTPPMSVQMVSLERFSPLFKNPKEFKIESIEPYSSYHNIFSDIVNIDKIGYHHTGVFESEALTDLDLRLSIALTFNQWKTKCLGQDMTLEMIQAGELGTLVIDTRGTINESTEFYLPSAIAELCFLIEDGSVKREDIDPDSLSQLIAKGLLLDYEGTLINLVVRYTGAKTEWLYPDLSPEHNAVTPVMPEQYIFG
ncbi:RiPP maturation radical SAM C-methyltransferase [bacterium]|nr:RiPP maturation radical SAM C-methyltransferase [bacterium]